MAKRDPYYRKPYDPVLDGIKDYGECAECGYGFINPDLITECSLCGALLCSRCYHDLRLCRECYLGDHTYRSNSYYMWGRRVCKTCYEEVGGKCFSCGKMFGEYNYDEIEDLRDEAYQVRVKSREDEEEAARKAKHEPYWEDDY